MPKPKNKGGKPGKPARQPARQPAAPEAPPEIQAVLKQIIQLARESPEGWGMIAQVLKDLRQQQEEAEPAVLMEFLARQAGREVLPLLRGAALDEDEEFALGALRALPVLGTRAAGDALAEAYTAYPEGERARAAWEGVEALQARGINVSVPEPDGVRKEVPAVQLRETWESMPDGVGGREIAARGQDRYGVWHTVMVVWNDQAGVKDGFEMAVSRREWQEIRERNEAEGVTLVQVPIEFARWQIARARELNARSGFALETFLEGWDRIVGPSAEEYEPPDPLANLRDLDPEEQRALADHLHCLLEEPTFNSWAIEPADLKPWFEEYHRLATDESRPEVEVDLEIMDLLAAAVRETVTPELAELIRARLVETARKFEWLKNEHAGVTAAAVALQIEQGGDLGEVALFRELAEKGLEMLHQMLEDGEDPEAMRYDPMAPLERHPEEA